MSLQDARRQADTKKVAQWMPDAPTTVADLFERFEDANIERKSFGDNRLAWEKWGKANLANLRLTDITRHHGNALIKYVTKHSSANRANAIIRYLRPMFAMAVREGWLEHHPWQYLALNKVGISKSRDRVLTLSEIATLRDWGRTEPYPWGPLLLTLMLTGQRLNEVGAMRWDEIDGNTWVIPRERYKTDMRHEVPLTGDVMAVLFQVPRHDDFVFSLRKGYPVKPGSNLKNRIDEATGLKEWRFHDIRRTAATLMGDAGISRFAVERTLGHVETGVTHIYDRSKRLAEKRAALEALANAVLS